MVGANFNKDETLTYIEQLINTNPLILFMKGTATMPRCGFSKRTADCLQECGYPFVTVDVVSEQGAGIRRYLPEFSNWPTFPQLFLKGELIGGCDIVTEMHENGEFKELLDQQLKDVIMVGDSLATEN